VEIFNLHSVILNPKGGFKMKKVLIAYDSRTGKTEKMAEGIAEGIRMGGRARAGTQKDNPAQE
jgi:flavorubredoxin